MLELEAKDYWLEIDPSRGGSVSRFQWRGLDVLRPSIPGSMLNCASFPLVLYSNRISKGQFVFEGRKVCLPPNLPAISELHPLHGTGWLANWSLLFSNSSQAVLEHVHGGNEHWPWPFCARQLLMLGESGLSMALSICNVGNVAMPAGLGFHPYFPRDPDTVYLGLHRGEWQNNSECLPEYLLEHPVPLDWWKGAPVGSRTVDTVYSGRDGALSIAWPSRGFQLVVQPSDRLGHTVVYVPRDADFFCVEPVSHMTNALNHVAGEVGMLRLEPGETVEVRVDLLAKAFAP